jgi:hypothetical protein
MNDIQLVLSSAGVAAVVSGLMTLLGQHLERLSRERENNATRAAKFEELCLSKAIEMAFEERRGIVEIALKKNKALLLPPDLISVVQIKRALKHLYAHDQLPEDYKAEVRKHLTEIRDNSSNAKDVAYIDDHLNSSDLRPSGGNLPRPTLMTKPKQTADCCCKSGNTRITGKIQIVSVL